MPQAWLFVKDKSDDKKRASIYNIDKLEFIELTIVKIDVLTRMLRMVSCM